MFYILIGKKVYKTDDIVMWSRAMENINKIIDKTVINNMTISTVFLGVNHAIGSTIPILFETMVFGGEYDGLMERYSTWDEAMSGHKLICDNLSSNKKKSGLRLLKRK